jgi:Sec-independent protein translocase protein TatA
MDIFGIGPTELAFIFLIALILLGPKDMQKAGKTIGRWMRDFVSSDSWRAFRDTSRELRNLPNRLMREANLDDLKDVAADVAKSADLRQDRFGSWANPAKPDQESDQTKSVPPPESSENQIAPPSTTADNKDPDQDA